MYLPVGQPVSKLHLPERFIYSGNGLVSTPADCPLPFHNSNDMHFYIPAFAFIRILSKLC